MSDERERRFRGGLDGRERPLDWRELAARFGIDESDARELHEEAMRRTGGGEEARRRRGRVYAPQDAVLKASREVTLSPPERR